MESEQVQLIKGLVTLITGAGGGLGRSLARAFADAGAFIAATDLIPDKLMETVRQIETQSRVIKGYPVEITKLTKASNLIEEVLRDWGRIDILINIPKLLERINFQDLNDWEWQFILDHNLSTPFYLMRAVSSAMALQAGGVILNFAAAEKLSLSEDGLGAIFACNAALISMTRTAARELDGDNIRVHAICSGDLALFSGEYDDIYDSIVSREMIDGIAKLAVYLSSLQASHLTGQVLQINRSTEP